MSEPKSGDLETELKHVLALQQGGEYVEAQARCQALIHEHPEVSVLHSLNASLCKMLGRLADSIASYHAAIKLDSDNPELYYNIGNCYS